MFSTEPFADAGDQFENISVIRGRKGKERQLLGACGSHRFFCSLNDLFHTAFADRAGDHTRLAKAAATRAAAHHFD